MSDATIVGADLQALQEIALPAPVSWLPQTVGWLVVSIAILLALALFGWRRWRHWRANQYRRDALAELAAIEQKLQRDDQQALRQLPALLKRTALGCTPRLQVAALSGADWLRFLERSAPGVELAGATGQQLWQLAYAPDAALRNMPRNEIDALCTLARRWIRHHVAV